MLLFFSKNVRRNTFVTLKKLNVVFAQKRKVSQGSNHISRRQSSRESNHVSKFTGDNQLSPKKQGDNHGETHQDVEYMQLQGDYNSTLINKCHCSGLSCLRDVDCNHRAIFSKNFIKAGEELCFHYNEGII
ncbi:hypothetical protein GQX74_000137 [Glossina fuscipes]|nr:hypothetical protein GQX74_000137 [Glossina fuscipes]